MPINVQTLILGKGNEGYDYLMQVGDCKRNRRKGPWLDM